MHAAAKADRGCALQSKAKHGSSGLERARLTRTMEGERMVLQCEICGGLAERVALASVYMAHLCIEHQNEWNKYCFILDEFIAVNVLIAYRDRAVLSGRESAHHPDPDLVELVNDLQEARLTLFQHAKEWVESKKAGA